MKLQKENKILRPKVIAKLEKFGYHVEITHGGMYQQGWPDLYCMHPGLGTYWVELKVPGGKLRRSQIEKFTLWSKYKVKIWVVTSHFEVPEIFDKPPNWFKFFEVR